MAFAVKGYEQRVDLGSNVSAPGIRPIQTNTGLGEAIERGASQAMATYERVTKEAAETESMAAASETRKQLEAEFIKQQEGAAPGATNFTPQFNDTVQKAIDNGAKGLTTDEARKRYRERMISASEQYSDRALNWEAGQRVAKRTMDFRTTADNNANSVYTVDGKDRDATFKNLQEDLNGSLDAIGLPPSTRDQLREEAKEKMANAAVQGDLRDRPEQVQDWLVKGNGPGYYSRLRGAESGGRNIGSDTSSAFGPYQFTAGTWTELLKSHPELGLSASDRFKPQAQEVAIRAFTKDNAAALTKAGIPVTDLNLYMAHFLGRGGGTQFIRQFQKDPNAEARTVVPPAVVAANRSIFKPGRTVGDVMKLFGGKFGQSVSYDKDTSAPTYYSELSFAKRDALYSTAETEMNRRRTDSNAAFTQRVQNTIAEYASNGSAGAPPTELEFVAAYGANKGTVAYGEYAARAQGAAAMHQMRNMTAAEMHGFVESHRPQEGDAFFAEKAEAFGKMGQIRDSATEALLNRENARDTAAAVEGQGAVAAKRALDKATLEARKAQLEAQAEAFARMSKARDEMIKLRADDFGGYTTMVDPRARDALKLAMGGDAAAAQQYSASVFANASRLNAPITRFLPKTNSEDLANSLNRSITTTVDATATVETFRKAKATWGNDWDRVLGDMKGQLSATARVVASDIAPRAATALVSVHDKSYEELTKPLEKTYNRDITAELTGTFKEYAKSAAYMPGDDAPVFFAQTQKLAAVYAGQGMTATEAARAAYADMVGNRYTFQRDTRVPVAQGDMSGPLTLAKDRVIKNQDFDVSRAPKGVSPEDLAAHMQANAEWVTAPNDKGVVLMVGGAAAHDKDGNVIARSWDDLRKLEALDKAERVTRPVLESFGGDFSAGMR